MHAALEAGAKPTHFGRCGLCSTLADLAVYIEVEDLTEPVRSCGLAHLRGPPEAHLECLRCDEEQSGDVFKAIAGRTRRNTGLPNAICRPCSEARPLIHDYP